MFTELGFAVFCQPQGQDFARTPAQHTHYHLPPANSELQTQAQQRWSTHRELVAPVLSSRTHSRRPAYQLFAGLWSLDSVKPQHQPTAAEGFWFAELEF